MTLREKFYCLGYEGPNEISQDFLYMEHNLISMVKVSYPKGEIVTCGSLYKITLLNNPKIGHLGKMITSPNW